MHGSPMLDVLILLTAAAVLGTVCERFRQSSILGYLAAGTLFGSWITNDEFVHVLAELGVAMLLFTIGLEFSWPRLKALGAVALGGGVLQISLTLGVVTGLALLVGLDSRPALALGAIVSLSSTACVLRMLNQRTELESVHGRHSMGILLLQDLALVPLVLLVTNLGGDASFFEALLTVGKAMFLALCLVVTFFLISNFLMCRLLNASARSRNRELPILLAAVICLASAWAADALSLSPALGAFAAGVMMAGTPFATQVRADVSVLKTLFVTIFFTSVGMLADLAWIAENWMVVTLSVSAVFVVKPLVILAILRRFRVSGRHALATGICLSQVGEFSFVLAEIARGSETFSPYMYDLVISTTLISLLLTPVLVSLASRIARHDGFRQAVVGDQVSGTQTSGTRASGGQKSGTQVSPTGEPVAFEREETSRAREGHVIVIGFGPAAQQVVRSVQAAGLGAVVLDLNPSNVEIARARGIQVQLGDATHDEVLEQLDVAAARAVVLTLPDHRASLQVIRKLQGIPPLPQ